MTDHPNARNREQRTYHEVRRLKESGPKGVARAPLVEEHGGLDRARLAALGYALDGPTTTGEQFTGTVEVHRLVSLGGRVLMSELVDVIDERVAFRLLNELSLPRADCMAVPVERLQEEANRLTRLGID
jgi:hypothetical protein